MMKALCQPCEAVSAKLDTLDEAAGHNLGHITHAYGTLMFGKDYLNSYYLLMRFFFAFYALAVFLWSQINMLASYADDYLLWYTYLTHWALTICVIYLNLSFYICFQIYFIIAKASPSALSQSQFIKRLLIHSSKLSNLHNISQICFN